MSKPLTEGLNFHKKSFLDFAEESQKRAHKLIEEIMARSPNSSYQDAMNTAIFTEMGRIWAALELHKKHSHNL